MTIHLISVGRSILETMEHARTKKTANGHNLFAVDLAARIHGRHPDLFLQQRVGNAEEASNMLTGMFGVNGSISPEFADLVAAVAPTGWPAASSAEVDTLEGAPDHLRHIESGHLIVLIATDTVDGLAGALWNAIALLRDGDGLNQIHYVADPADGLPEIHDASVLIVRVPGLDAANLTGFVRAMRGLGLLGRALLPAPEQPPARFRFYLSGGFKAAIPYLLGLAEGLRSEPLVGLVEAFVAHETHAGEPLLLPLRKMNKNQVMKELAHFTADGLGPEPDSLLLEDYLYWKEPSGVYRISGFGECMRALFGFGHESVGN